MGTSRTIQHQQRPVEPLQSKRDAFTLIELIVVVAIVAILVTLVLPATSALWENRRIADAENTIRGLLSTTRARSTIGSGTQSGLFFFISEAGVQTIVPIEQDPEQAGKEEWENIFRVAGPARTLPAPMRVVPRYAVEDDQPGAKDDFITFTEVELANDDFTNPPPMTNKTQRHRNHFSMVYSNEGQLVVWRDVLIRDEDTNTADPFLVGDVTGLPVSPGANESGTPVVNEYHTKDDNKAMISRVNLAMEYLVVEDETSTVAINFPSVDGLLVYDDSVFRDIDDPLAQREYLLDQGQPFYVSRITGSVIRGPLGENR